MANALMQQPQAPGNALLPQQFNPYLNGALKFRSNVERGTLLPIETNTLTGERRLAMPQVLLDAANALTAPGRAARGEYQLVIDPATGVNYLMGMPEDAANLAGMVTLGAGAVPRPTGTLDMGFKAYHGSPHDFDKFSMNKIGTGEGAQAYGHGLYFAESPDVANSYRTDLSTVVSVDGKPIVSNNRRVGSTGNSDIDDFLSAYNGDIDAAIAEVSSFPDIPGYGDLLQQLKALKGRVSASTSGKFYEVDIDAEPGDFLDWEKPLSQQPKKARKALEKMLATRGNWKAVTGNNADPTIQELNAVFNFQNPTEVERLRAAGIPGIKYLDQGSRGGATGTRNFVVFDDNLISILSKK